MAIGCGLEASSSSWFAPLGPVSWSLALTSTFVVASPFTSHVLPTFVNPSMLSVENMIQQASGFLKFSFCINSKVLNELGNKHNIGQLKYVSLFPSSCGHEWCRSNELQLHSGCNTSPPILLHSRKNGCSP